MKIPARQPHRRPRDADRLDFLNHDVNDKTLPLDGTRCGDDLVVAGCGSKPLIDLELHIAGSG